MGRRPFSTSGKTVEKYTASEISMHKKAVKTGYSKESTLREFVVVGKKTPR